MSAQRKEAPGGGRRGGGGGGGEREKGGILYLILFNRSYCVIITHCSTFLSVYFLNQSNYTICGCAFNEL